MAFPASVCEGVASKTTPLVEHRELRVTTGLELRQRHVAARRLVVAAAAKISHVADRAGGAIQRRVFSVDIVLPAGRVRYGQHYLVAADAFLLAHGRRRDVHMANKTGRARLGRFVTVMQPESFRMRRRLHDAGVKLRHRAGLYIHMTNLAIGHLKVRGEGFRYVMAIHAVRHFWQIEAGKTGARGNSVVAGRAIEMIGVAALEMLGVRKLNLGVLPRNYKGGQFAVNRRGAGIFDFLRPMAPAAVRGRGLLAEQRFHPGFGMAAGANFVVPEGGIRAIVLEMMAERAIRAESRARIYSRMRVHVPGVREIEYDRPLVLIAREWQ